MESRIEFRVRYAETDRMGVVYHANYLIWCEMGRTDLMRRLGTSYADLERRGIHLTVADARIRLRNSARYDDRIRVKTVVTRVRSRGVSFAYQVENLESGVDLASAETDLICVDGQGSTRKLPADVRALLTGEKPSSDGRNLETLSGVE
ncbi:MAG: acyl-CoA thioesterase [Gemmatimonadetes bacterium]|uniref:Acyl-CoA thioesterase n=1 Tax=Candidatus Kutchimonas denitrificans TaxID=3056748 RepID=A0AAE5CDG6_9BACT|nr:acyl-CoA thioesterase [Gemmatimonadota bacterium]NIR75734.1 acyl-CoA thioesterase [Candidatus Kutchimonas denitrificans]NIS00347.1 acyl-CoA thioesterase [Gemmatimonadota bacterium]NIT66006.1 acyl-CoA thioesterase [Gemmatimonadota bacterium]NIU53710.1 YbgC/FadM family acyl-CoA thioesterase [Gemmatimonadota bacterium]